MTTPSGAHHGTVSESEAAEIAEVASRVRLIVGRLSRRLRLDPGGDRLTPTQLATLSTIERCAPLRSGDLAAAEGISKASMTRVVTVMADLGLIERRADPHDGRACQVQLSAHGRSELARLRSQRTGYIATRLSACTPEQRAALLAAMPVLELIAQDASGEA